MFEWKQREAAGGKKTREKPNRTGIPGQLKKSLEQNTGFSLDDVRVHYHSDRPARLDALAYTQGNQVYIGPGQEKHLPHELGHVVQQKAGIVHADTRHESGAAMNTDAALERQADEIGSGRRYAAKRPQGADTGADTVQRMSVFERGEDGQEKVWRYKRQGWIALQGLRKYFTMESLKGITYREMKEYNDNLQKFIASADTNSVDTFRNLCSKLQFCIEINQNQCHELAKVILELTAQVIQTEKEADKKAGTEQGEGAASGESEEGTEAEDERQDRKIAETGSYDRGYEINKSNDYKKRGMHYIAKQVGDTLYDGGKTAGPHIAVSVLGGRIYLARNSSLAKAVGKQAAKPEELMAAADEVLRRVKTCSKEEITAAIRAADETYEDKDAAINDRLAKMIYDWLLKISGYEIVVIGVPDTSVNPGGGSVHGEMAILDYLEKEKEKPSVRIPGMPKTISQILRERNEKLSDLKMSGQMGTRSRVIRFGGTKVDCKKCHEHFADAAELIANNRIVSSDKAGEGRGEGGYFRGTEKGTKPADTGSARIQASALTVHFDEMNLELTKLLMKLTAIAEQPGTTAASEEASGTADSSEAAEILALSEEEEELIGELNTYRTEFESGEIIEEIKGLQEVRELMDQILTLYSALSQGSRQGTAETIETD